MDQTASSTTRLHRVLVRLGPVCLALTAAAVVAVFVWPADPVAKAQALVHGLCAQRLDRTYRPGGQPLPFDARMTGLYLGAVWATPALLLARRRGCAVAWPWLVLLGLAVGAMGVDGLNSLRHDLGLSVAWEPTNILRLTTGLLAGGALGVALAWLLNTAWSGNETALLRPRDLLFWSAGAGLSALTVLAQPAWAYWPLTLALLGGAIGTVAALNLAVLVLTLSARQAVSANLRWPLVYCTLPVALVEIGLLASGRAWLEAVMLGGPR